MSSLLDRIRAEAEVQKPDLETWLERLAVEERAELERAARNWTERALEQFIREEGVRVSQVSIRRWKATL